MGLPVGARLGPYEVVAPLGSGGMGEVCRAFDRKLDLEIAIKVLVEALADDPAVLARFQREAKVVVGLSHPNQSIGLLIDVELDRFRGTRGECGGPNHVI